MAPLFDFVSLPAFTISACINMFIGMVWYGALFGNTFIRLAHNGRMPKKGESTTPMIISTLASLIAMPFFSFLLGALQVRTAGQGALWGTAIGFFFDGAINLPHPFFEARPIPLFILHRGYHTVSLTAVGTVLGALCGGQ